LPPIIVGPPGSSGSLSTEAWTSCWGSTDFGERELRRWWRDHDVLPWCEERIVGAEQEPNAIIKLITTSVRWDE
jgi:hypothetical protein